MTQRMQHLSDEQLNGALIGDLAAEAAGHLAACAQCQQQVEEIRLPLESFKAVSLAWSERQSATMPVSMQRQMLHNAAGSRRRAWGTALAATLAVFIAVPFGWHRGSESATSDTTAMEAAQAVGATGVVSGQMQSGELNPEQIASDNQMLIEIERELDSSTARSAVIELQGVQGQANRPAAGRSIQD